jgi:hypothetical protein
MKAPHRRRRCLCCKELFWPDPRNRYHQRFCSKPACRQASHQLSQQRWVAKGNEDRWRGPEEVQRVRDWRQAHPGYWKKKVSVPGRSTLQEDCHAQAIAPKPLPAELVSVALQDDWRGDQLIQHPLLVGLLSMLTGSTLQEDIATTTRRLIAKGREMLGIVPSAPALNYDAKKTPGSGALAPNPQPV